MDSTRADFPVPEDELVTIRVFDGQAELLVARSVLESADIQCFVKPAYVVPKYSGAGSYATAAHVALQVHKSDAEDALAILDAPPLDQNSDIEE